MTRETLTELLRGRILRGLHTGALAPGDRLPSARTVAADSGADHRTVLTAYRALAAEGLVELRERTGVYVARRGHALAPTPGIEWLTDTLLQGLARDVPVVELHEWMRRAVATRRLRAIVVEGTQDQMAGMCRELRDDFGLDATGVDAAALAEPSAALLAHVRDADVLVSTPAFAQLVRAFGQRVAVPVVITEAGPDLLGGEWQALLREPLYLIVADERSVAGIRESFSGIPKAAEHLHLLVVGRDDLASIPADAAVYVTRGAAAVLGTTSVGGRRVPSARAFSIQAAKEIVSFIVRANMAARPRVEGT